MGAKTRQSRVRELDRALAPIEDGSVVGIGGTIISDHPMALVRGLIRKRTRGLTVVSPTAGLDVDLLIGAGCVERIHTAYVGAEGLAPIGPSFRAAAEQGALEVRDLCEGQCVAGLRAAAQSLPFMPWRGGVGTSLPVLNPDLVEFTDPIRGEPLIAVPALELDFALIHADRADRYGNVQIAGTGFMDGLLAAAAKTVIVQVNEVVANSRIRESPSETRFWRDTVVVEAPYGTHPYATSGMTVDETALNDYLEAARAAARGDRAALELYLDREVRAVADQARYLDHIGIDRVRSLAVSQ